MLLVVAGPRGQQGHGDTGAGAAAGRLFLQPWGSLCTILVLVQTAVLSEGFGPLCFPALHHLIRAVGAKRWL